jgi:hypothetical protein
MISQDVELIEARGDLATFLGQLPPNANDHELVELLLDMNQDDALTFRWDGCRGLPTRLWCPVNPAVYAHRVLGIEPQLCVVLAELFLGREIEFSGQTPSREIRWHRAMPWHEDQ